LYCILFNPSITGFAAVKLTFDELKSIFYFGVCQGILIIAFVQAGWMASLGLAFKYCPVNTCMPYGSL